MFMMKKQHNRTKFEPEYLGSSFQSVVTGFLGLRAFGVNSNILTTIVMRWYLPLCYGCVDTVLKQWWGNRLVSYQKSKQWNQ
jgi:hypothetical protein